MNEFSQIDFVHKQTQWLWSIFLLSVFHFWLSDRVVAQARVATEGFFDLVSADDPMIPQLLLSTAHSGVVQRELGLSDEQIDQLEAILREIDQQWWPSRILPVDQQREKVADLEGRFWERMLATFPASVSKRLQQIELQAQGPRLVLRKDVADALQLTPIQRDEFRSAFLRFDKQRSELVKKKQQDPSADVQQQLTDLNRTEVESSYALLSPQQKERLATLLGEMLDFETVRRTFPFAPELLNTNEWFGEPTTLAESKGKVVIVHFYAFQCVNCRRNFAHYRDWVKQFEGKDVVVIGIQSPETAAESDPGRVRDAAARDNFNFPVLIDIGQKNWDAWGNTMWPTVYVIDRRGYIRFWWQGELNWQGAEGDEVIRDLVAELLEEN